ncbi:MAG TPA: hypothetical protein VLF69_03695 [Candidatus Saccharimonadales bacterium]|nr:hypothetical protein [Candidatus Saccharimonadales bacterium]
MASMFLSAGAMGGGQPGSFDRPRSDMLEAMLGPAIDLDPSSRRIDGKLGTLVLAQAIDPSTGEPCISVEAVRYADHLQSEITWRTVEDDPDELAASLDKRLQARRPQGKEALLTVGWLALVGEDDQRRLSVVLGYNATAVAPGLHIVRQVLTKPYHRLTPNRVVRYPRSDS